MRVEQVVLSNLLENDEYMRKVIPYIRDDYFQDPAEQTVFKLIDGYVAKYNSVPPKEALLIELHEATNLSETIYKSSTDLINSLKSDSITKMDWLIDTTETFCKDKALFNAVATAIAAMNDEKSKIPKTAIPKLLQDALGVSFDTHIGHDFIEDADSRFEYYHRSESRTPFDLEMLNKITGGGLPDKTLSVIMAPTGVGKSMIMCHMAAANLMAGKNVLYITMEMAEERIAERIDANLLNVALGDMKDLPKDAFDSKIERVKSRTKGKLIIKEYPTASAGASNFRHLLNELHLKKGFKADVIYIDYLNICISSRMKNMGDSYGLVKAIAEEVRGLAVEFEVPIISATQVNRSGMESSDISMIDTSESIGLTFTVDLLLAITQTEQMAELGQISVKQLKNRFGDINLNKRFYLGIDKSKMRFFDIDQHDNKPDKPLMDNTSFGEKDFDRSKGKSKFKSKFDQFK